MWGWEVLKKNPTPNPKPLAKKSRYTVESTETVGLKSSLGDVIRLKQGPQEWNRVKGAAYYVIFRPLYGSTKVSRNSI